MSRRFCLIITAAVLISGCTATRRPKFQFLADTRIGVINRLDVIIVIKSFRGPGVFKIAKHPIVLQGYGLFTKVFLISKQAHAYANLTAVVFKTEPLKYIGSGKPTIEKSPLKDFEFAGDLKNLPQSEIDKLEPIIQKYADQAIVNALAEANLISK